MCENAHREGIPVGICGEIASDDKMTEIFLSLGVDELSMSSPFVLGIRRKVRSINVGAVRDEILSCTKEDIRSLSENIKAAFSKEYICVVGAEGKIKENEKLFDKVINLMIACIQDLNSLPTLGNHCSAVVAKVSARVYHSVKTF